MAMPQPNNTNRTRQRETVEFPPNVPVTLSLAYSEPRIVSARGGERAMFTTGDGRVMFVDPPVAAQIVALGINVRESFTVTRKSTGKKGAADTWEVARVPGEQPNGTLVVPKLPEPAATPKPMQQATAPTRTGLVAEGCALVDAYAQILEYGLTTYSGKVKPDEIRALTVTAYIQRRQLSSVA